MSRWVSRFLMLTGVWVLGQCGWWPGSSRSGWQGAVEMQASQLGYRNWIVIAESSFPAHNRPGTRQVNTYESIPVVLDEVLQTLERTEHVRPTIYLPRELPVVENDLAPGIDAYRRTLDQSLHGYAAKQLDQDSLLTLVHDAQRSFDVLVLRTTTALPYSSVFIELEPGYWDGQSEQRLRNRLQQGRQAEKLASPSL